MGGKLKPWDRSHQSGQDPINTSPEEGRMGLKKRLAGEDNSLLDYIM